MMSPDLTVTDEAARARLARAAEYLDVLPPNRFTMRQFAVPGAHGATPLPARTLDAPCDTVGCLAGHIPHIDPEWTHAYIDAHSRLGPVQIEFPELANAFIGRPRRDGTGPVRHYCDDPLYCWLFNGLWHEVDDTPRRSGRTDPDRARRRRPAGVRRDEAPQPRPLRTREPRRILRAARSPPMTPGTLSAGRAPSSPTSSSRATSPNAPTALRRPPTDPTSLKPDT